MGLAAAGPTLQRPESLDKEKTLFLISRSAGLTMPLRDTSTEYTRNGDVLKVHPAISVQFGPGGGAPDWAKDAVQKLPGWGSGLGHNEDPFSRVGVLDTDLEAINQNWSAEDKEFVENALRRAGANGVQYVICEAPRAAKPWSTYDEFVGEDAVAKILYTIELVGADPKAVLRYEQENLNRAEVVEAIEAKIEADADEVVGVISV